MQRAGSGAIQAGSPLVMFAVLVTLPALVFVTFSVTTVSATKAGATPNALVQVIVARPTAVVGVHTQPAPLTRLVRLTPAGSTS